MKKPHQKFKRGNLVKSKFFTIGIVLEESIKSNWWGDVYTRWYWILTENGTLIEEVEKYLEFC